MINKIVLQLLTHRAYFGVRFDQFIVSHCAKHYSNLSFNKQCKSLQIHSDNFYYLNANNGCYFYGTVLHYYSTIVKDEPISISDTFRDKKYVERSNRIYFSGIQPTGVPHLGNYLSVIEPWCRLQQNLGKLIFAVVDLHALTSENNRIQLRQNIHSTFCLLLACGISPKRTILFQQSRVPEHTILSWILSTLITKARLEHLPAWKEKLRDPSVGLYTYPVLQAADIMLYRATHVPVGRDQLQHLQVARYAVRQFNNKFGSSFPIPMEDFSSVHKVACLRHPKNKMNKSEESSLGRIDFLDTADEIYTKIKKAVTDSEHDLHYDAEKRPGLANLIRIYSGVTGQELNTILPKIENWNKVRLKDEVASAVIEKFNPICQEFRRLLADPHYVNTVILEGSKRASEIATINMREVLQVTGLRTEDIERKI